MPTKQPLPAIEIGVPLQHIGIVLGAATCFFSITGAAMAIANVVFGHNSIYGLYPLFYLGHDSSIPSWYASITLLICSALLAVHARISRRAGERYAMHWLTLAVIFFLLSLDEVARIHETVGAAVGERASGYVGQMGGLLYYAWVIPGTIFVVIVGMMYIGFLRALPPTVRWGMVAAGAIFVGGAVGAEMYNARVDSMYGNNLHLQLGTVFEEFLEMAGIALFAHVLARYLAHRVQDVRLRLILGD